MKYKLTSDQFNQALIQYIQQMSKQQQLPKHIENQLLRQVTKG